MSSSPNPLVSIVVTTKNEESNIENCLISIRDQSYKNIEIIVVDNYSTDNTRTLAARYTKNVVLRGPERCAQRNFGLLDIAVGEYGMFIDADMILAPEVVAKSVSHFNQYDVTALYIHEVIVGNSRIARIRRFERDFYSATDIDCVRIFRRPAFIKSGGFSEKLDAGGEDWDFNRKILQIGRCELLEQGRSLERDALPKSILNLVPRNHISDSVIFHNDGISSLVEYLGKKATYSEGIRLYVNKWGRNDEVVRRQVGVTYRLLTVFIEKGKWRKSFCAPHLLLAVIALKGMLGFVLVMKRIRDLFVNT